MKNRVEEILKKIKTNRASKFIAILLLYLFLLLPTWYVNKLAGYAGMLFFTILLAMSYVALIIMERSIVADSAVQGETCIRGESRDVGIKVNNTSLMITPRVTARIYMSNLFGNIDSWQDVNFSLGGLSTSDFAFRATMNHIGVYTLGLRDMYVYDMFGFFKKKIYIDNEREITVIPRDRNLEEISRVLAADAEEQDDGVMTADGADYSGVRDYAAGDSMKLIHWKLSARSEGYYTKILESPKQSSFSVIIDFSAPHYDENDLMELNDCLIESTFAIIKYMKQSGFPWDFTYANRYHKIVEKDGDDKISVELAGDFERIYDSTKEFHTSAAEMINENGSKRDRTSNLILCTTNPDSTVLQEIINQKKNQRCPEVFLIIPEKLNSREREKAIAPILALDDMNIPYHVFTTKLNNLGAQNA